MKTENNTSVLDKTAENQNTRVFKNIKEKGNHSQNVFGYIKRSITIIEIFNHVSPLLFE